MNKAAIAETIKGGGLNKVALTVAGLATAMGAMAVAKPWGRVPEGHVALREDFDAVDKDSQGRIKPELVESGVRYKAPFKGVLKLVDVRIRETRLEDIGVYRNNELWRAKFSIFWRIPPYEEPVYRALYKASGSDDLDGVVSSIFTDGLHRIYKDLPDSELENSDLVDAMLYNRHGDELHAYGVELESVKIRSITPDPAEILKSGLLQARLLDADALAANRSLGVVA